MSFVLPVKALTLGKSRLDLPAGQRAALLEAMLTDTITAAVQADLGPVLVVSPDPAVLAVARAHAAQGITFAGPLNEAVRFAAQGHQRHAALLPDLPALRPHELHDALGFAHSGFVPDHTGKGTTMLFGTGQLAPRFGPDSARLHETAGYPRVTVPLPGLRHDVDTLDDLLAVQTLGVGPCTRAFLTALGADPRLRVGPQSI